MRKRPEAIQHLVAQAYARGEAAAVRQPLSNEQLRALDTFWCEHPEAIQYVFAQAYASGEKEGFTAGRQQRDRQRRGKEGETGSIGRPAKHSVLLRSLLETAVDERPEGVTQDGALAAVVTSLFESEYAEGFKEFSYLKSKMGRSSFLASRRMRARRKE